MKILMVQTQLGYGGAETSFIRLANLLAQSMDVTVALFAAKGTYDAGHEPLHAPVMVLDDGYSTKLQRWIRRIAKLRALKQQHDVTISFLSGPNLANVLAGRNHASIVSLRGSRVYDPVAPAMQQAVFRYLLDPIIYWLAAVIVPVSDGLRHEIPRWAHRKLRIISPFVEPDILAVRLGEPVPEPYTTLKGQHVIVAAGRLSVEKGFHHLLRVFVKVTAQRPGTKLLLIGDGPMLQELRAQCAHLSLAVDDSTPGTSAVLFAGYHKNILPLLRLGSVYALTSATEGFPNVVLEAMAAGIPVIAADTPWGARAILCDESVRPADPYPTATPTITPYGTLMPRIDLPQHERAWVDTLLATPPAPVTARVQDFSLAVVGQKWKELVASLVRP